MFPIKKKNQTNKTVDFVKEFHVFLQSATINHAMIGTYYKNRSQKNNKTKITLNSCNG